MGAWNVYILNLWKHMTEKKIPVLESKDYGDF